MLFQNYKQFLFDYISWNVDSIRSLPGVATRKLHPFVMFLDCNKQSIKRYISIKIWFPHTVWENCLKSSHTVIPHGIHNTSHITHHTSHTSHITQHTSHTSHITHHISVFPHGNQDYHRYISSVLLHLKKTLQ